MKKLIGLSALALGVSAQAGFAASVEQTHQAVAQIMNGATGNSQNAGSVQAGGMPGTQFPQLPLNPTELRPPSPPLIPTLGWGRRPVNLGQGLVALGRSYSLGTLIGAGCGAITGGVIGWNIAATGIALAAGIGGGLVLGLFLGFYLLGGLIHEIKRGPGRIRG